MLAVAVFILRFKNHYLRYRTERTQTPCPASNNQHANLFENKLKWGKKIKKINTLQGWPGRTLKFIYIIQLWNNQNFYFDTVNTWTYICLCNKIVCPQHNVFANLFMCHVTVWKYEIRLHPLTLIIQIHAAVCDANFQRIGINKIMSLILNLTVFD